MATVRSRPALSLVARRRGRRGKKGWTFKDKTKHQGLSLAYKMSAMNPGFSMLPRSLISSLKNPDYSPWQRKETTKKQTFRLPISLSEPKKEGKKRAPQKSKDRSVSGKTPVFGLKMPMRQKPHLPQVMTKEMIMGESLDNIKIMQRIAKSRRSSLDKLKHHSNVLLKKNQELVEKIKEMDADTARQARDLLQQHDMFGTILTTLVDSSENQVGRAKRELLEKEKMVEKNMGKLDMEMTRTNAKVQALQDELNVLRSYMDKEYPVKAVQIASLMRSIRNLNEEQQDELDDVEDLSQRFLETLAEKAFEEQEHVYQSIAEKKLRQYQDGLEQMSRNNLELKRQIAGQKEIIGELVKEIKELHRSIIKLHHSIGDPRDVIFADVLLRRPKCTPDMDVVLNIPTDEDFPL
ncbi:uncharacterized protein C20orf96 homolog isoform X2 [Sceloporus undulatus]|uniref:uncharacterized protein C20orf96 homolog isoform X2 n=1 Tax=Sceloporus undulatus TaxID=8520 RepID=UPI001C4D48F8|nr:uncharacterized protein C20orf96 homolog isoform X2 [Sceloporus undulatus]